MIKFLIFCSFFKFILPILMNNFLDHNISSLKKTFKKANILKILKFFFHILYKKLFLFYFLNSNKFNVIKMSFVFLPATSFSNLFFSSQKMLPTNSFIMLLYDCVSIKSQNLFQIMVWFTNAKFSCLWVWEEKSMMLKA